jgi:hypothetical protein
MHFTTKVAVIVREDLPTWQKLNVASFLAGGLVGAYPELAGERYRDSSGRLYGPLIRQPVLIFAATSQELMRTLARACEGGVLTCVYTSALFRTSNDVDNRAAVATSKTDELDLVGLSLHADRKDVDRIVKGLKLHP